MRAGPPPMSASPDAALARTDMLASDSSRDLFQSPGQAKQTLDIVGG